jgi:hypothetical protein
MYWRSTWVAAEFADLCPDRQTQLLEWNNGPQIVEEAGQKGEHRLIALNVPAVNK